jgi:hypothetical protein
METVLRRANTEGECYNITFMLLRTKSCDTRPRPRAHGGVCAARWL